MSPCRTQNNPIYDCSFLLYFVAILPNEKPTTDEKWQQWCVVPFLDKHLNEKVKTS